MSPDTENDTRSPWFEAFAPQSRPSVDQVRWVSSAADIAGADHAAQPDAADPDHSKEALFDCYNG